MPDQGGLLSAARRAPSGPGVYIFLGTNRELLYVGKATNLHRRLLDHARNRWEALWSTVADVRWIECSDERDALCREADLVVALAPRFNAVMVADAFTFVAIGIDRARGPALRLRFALTEDARTECDRIYGAFPHLGKGKASWRAVRTNAGYSALLRLVWVAFADADRSRIPARLRGSSPPVSHETAFESSQLPLLHAFLSGRSSRLLSVLCETVTSDALPAFMRPNLASDLDLAEDFYRLGPQALRRLRLRHGLPRGPVDRDGFVAVQSADLRTAVGDFELSVPERLRGPGLSRAPRT